MMIFSFNNSNFTQQNRLTEHGGEGKFKKVKNFSGLHTKLCNSSFPNSVRRGCVNTMSTAIAINSLFLSRFYSYSSNFRVVDKSIPVVKTLQNEQAQIVLNRMFEHSSAELRSFLDKNVMHLLDSKYLVDSKFLLNDVDELKSLKDSDLSVFSTFSGVYSFTPPWGVCQLFLNM